MKYITKKRIISGEVFWEQKYFDFLWIGMSRIVLRCVCVSDEVFVVSYHSLFCLADNELSEIRTHKQTQTRTIKGERDRRDIRVICSFNPADVMSFSRLTPSPISLFWPRERCHLLVVLKCSLSDNSLEEYKGKGQSQTGQDRTSAKIHSPESGKRRQRTHFKRRDADKRNKGEWYGYVFLSLLSFGRNLKGKHQHQ